MKGKNYNFNSVILDLNIIAEKPTKSFKMVLVQHRRLWG